jgi:UDP-N-acetylmuramoyl-L-alanyl-D-glutamate--2,6-diaminopimelate ligase
MKLHELLSILPGVALGPAGLGACEVTSLCFDSRRLEKDCVFVAIRGGKADGHAYLGEAAKLGASAVVVEDQASVPADFAGAVAVVKDTREALNRLAARYFADPAKKLFCAGVTGTNGKTTTTYMIEAILNRHAMPTGVVGTINHHLGTRVWKTEMTTPDPLSFQQRLAEFVSGGAKAVALEVSSHALSQSRVDEVPFDVAVFTNLSRDHLDYHKDMEDYFEAKEKLFKDLLARSTKPRRVAVVNGDDEYGRRLAALGVLGGDGRGDRPSVWTYGAAKGAEREHDISFEVLEQGFGGTRFRLKAPVGAREFKILMTGLHNVYNACGAIGAALVAGASLDTCAEALGALTGVAGRLEAVPNFKGLHIFVDYAHTDDALHTVLHYLRGIREAAGLKNRIITVFGCGGDRDKGKRPLMMKAAARGSDLVVVTSDNPRTEDPEAIIADALAGADPSALGKTVFKEADRRKGIRLAIEMAKPGDVVLIAGKGHEDYQQIGTTKFPFSDVEVVKEIME